VEGCAFVAFFLAACTLGLVWTLVTRVSRLEKTVTSLEGSTSAQDETGKRLNAIEKRLGHVEALIATLAKPGTASAPAKQTQAAAPAPHPAVVTPATAAPAAVAIPAPPPLPPPPEIPAAPRLPASPPIPAQPMRPGSPSQPPPPSQPVATRAVISAPDGTSVAADRGRPHIDAAPPPAAVGAEAGTPTESWGDRIRAGLAGDEWEAVVGGSWANKIGVGSLVIGVALLLGFWFPRMGPAGRVAMGLAISLTMLGTGVWVERRERYVVFARGLIGGGWASLYFTAYAMHGLDAARVIESALTGVMLLTAVAIGMIGHSLRYRSQVVTGLAYFLAFVALSLGGSPGFSLVALVPLVASLLVVTRRFSWAPMMLAGLGLTYGTYLVAASGSPNPTIADFVRAEAVLAVYWLLFETFDLVELGKGRISPVTAALFPLNACAFLGISMLQWQALTPDTVYLLFGATGVAYVVSAVIRARLRPPSSFGADSDVMDRAAVGSYEFAITVATALLTWGSAQRFAGLQFALAVFMLAEMLFVSGRSVGQWYLRMLGTVLLVVPLGQIAIVASSTGATIAALGLQMQTWIPLAALVAAACYVNRALLRSRERLLVERPYNAVASAIVIIIAACLAPDDQLGLAWFVIALVLFEVGALTRAAEFRVHAYAGIGLALAAIFTVNVPAGPPYQWIVPAIASALCYLFSLRQVYGANTAPEGERESVRISVSIPASLLFAIVVWMLVPADYLGLAWLALAFPLYEVAARTRGRDLRFHAYVFAAAGLGAVIGVNLVNAVTLQWPIPAAASLMSYLLALRQVYGPHAASPAEREFVRITASIPATILTATAVWILVPANYVGLAWFALAFPLYEVAARTRGRDLRLHAYALAAAALATVTRVNLVDAVSPQWPIPAAASAMSYLLASRQVFGRNRIADEERLFVRTVLTIPGAALAATAFWIALPDPYFRIAWLAFAAALFEVGVNSSWTELKYEAYVLGGLGIAAVGTLDAFGSAGGGFASQLTMLGSAAILIVWYLRLTLRRPARLAANVTEADMVRHVCSGAAIVFLGALLWHTAAVPALAIGWAALALLAIFAGDALGDEVLRGQGHAAMAAALVRAAVSNVDIEGAVGRLSQRLLTVLPLIGGCYGLAHRIRGAGERAALWELVLARGYVWASALLAISLLWYELGPTFASVGWMGLVVGLLIVGIRWKLDDLRVQAYLLAVATFALCWVATLEASSAAPGLADPRVVGGAVIVLLFVAQLLTPRTGAPLLTTSPSVAWLDGHARTGFAMLGTGLMTVLLYHETSARMLTMAWGVEAAAILVFGFVARERALRLSGLLLLAVCVVKLFALDFRELDAMARIISFIVLGLLLVAASWVYTRYRDQLHRYL
jgi:hypothetical protein